MEIEEALKIERNSITVDDYLKLRESVGWKKLTKKQAEKALKNCLGTVCVTMEGQPIGMGRLVGDGSVICYIQDLIIHPSVQSKGIGSILIKELIAYVEEFTEDGTEMMLDLMCAKGRESFYKKYGFIARPTSQLGPGMIRYIDKKM